MAAVDDCEWTLADGILGMNMLVYDRWKVRGYKFTGLDNDCIGEHHILAYVDMDVSFFDGLGASPDIGDCPLVSHYSLN